MEFRNRNGFSGVQVAVVLAVVVVVVITAVQLLGTATSNHLQTTAGNVADPSSLAARVGSMSSEPSCGDDVGTPDGGDADDGSSDDGSSDDGSSSEDGSGDDGSSDDGGSDDGGSSGGICP